ncbi:hypothetical protein SLA2020_368560 [Shorea laevis]
MESDEEIRRVPEIGGEVAGASVAGGDAGSVGGPNRVQPSGESQRKRGRRSLADKEKQAPKEVVEEKSFSAARNLYLQETESPLQH